ncbi:MAG: tetratricopeptide repeat protein [Nitrospinae bacterium]|nr:tetratricopeptide repeat protein [Nitrospinota bacterium]
MWKKVIFTALLVLPLIMLGGFNDAQAKDKNPCAKNPCAAKNPCGAKNPCAMKNPCAAKNPCAVAGALVCPKDVKPDACHHNVDGISHFKEGHWDVAAKHFSEAVKADPNFAEAHYNLALSLDKQGKHAEATEHFKMALKHGAKNEMIQKSEILKHHVGKNPCGTKNPCGKK